MHFSQDHLAVLRAIEEAGGALTLSEIVDGLDPGVMTAPGMEFARRSIRCAQVAGELHRMGLIERRPLSNQRILTEQGRAALAREVG